MARRQVRKYSGFARRDRVSEAVMRTVAQSLRTGLADPSLQDVTITQVEMSTDNRVAKIWFSLMGSEDQVAAAMKGFHAAMGRLRHDIAEAVRLQFTPELRFIQDTALDNAQKMEEIFRRIREERELNPPEIGDDDGAVEPGDDDDDE
ncbi:MAG: 30S ribosome-binding factor RbfA [Deltaproteobacteria bacterium]|nr:30S ribosome-binding factor RbfA [Deltaproteobacteria bacterium]